MTQDTSSLHTPAGRVLALCGGVGGARLARGLNALIPTPGQLTVAVNTGDDFEHLGLTICPDLDSVLYGLSGKNDEQRGWGRADETWHCLEALKELGAADWFALGDRDLAMHIERSHRLRAGETLSGITARFCERLGIAAHVLPMSDDPVRTTVHTDEGELAFQEYFVRRASRPKVQNISYRGADTARPNEALLQCLADRSLEAVVICPSNPQLSIDPILALPGMRQALRDVDAPVIVVSPLIGGRAVKGPAAKIMAELELSVDSAGIAQVYLDFLDGLVIDTQDADDADRVPVPALATPTLMRCQEDSTRLAAQTLAFAHALRTGPQRVNGTTGR
ncbi:2-phospho-L-lactate transferase [Pusillimonas caeni]|uniref:2-phospho-L-lactate transferase n=1 Tax=Pusillimonas caeni TaxID=1348472 RepID=UPI000E59B49B|nr:2-phospho-L-lactate transferase [Pusillimonas caeni]TFL08817.1 2-phospho-L-lactate transferase [Pusillimonas caeni]